MSNKTQRMVFHPTETPRGEMQWQYQTQEGGDYTVIYAVAKRDHNKVIEGKVYECIPFKTVFHDKGRKFKIILVNLVIRKEKELFRPERDEEFILTFRKKKNRKTGKDQLQAWIKDYCTTFVPNKKWESVLEEGHSYVCKMDFTIRDTLIMVVEILDEADQAQAA